MPTAYSETKQCGCALMLIGSIVCHLILHVGMCVAEISGHELQGLLHKGQCMIVPNDDYLVQEQQNCSLSVRA